MGKIKTEGRVTLEFEPDLYEISITVYAEGKTSGAAITAGKKQTEALLQALQDNLQIKPEQISAEDESASAPNPYQDSRNDYRFSRTLLLTVPADNQLREAVTDLLADTDAVTYTVMPKLEDESVQKQTVMLSAVQLAKSKAEQIAASLCSRVTGFDEICTDGLRLSEECFDSVPACGALRAMKNLAENLQNPKIKIDGDVTVTWLTEPIE